MMVPERRRQAMCTHGHSTPPTAFELFSLLAMPAAAKPAQSDVSHPLHAAFTYPCPMPSAINSRLPQIWHGGDYNPEQWPAAIWDEDMRLMQAAHFNVATVGVFSWVALQPSEDRFAFEWLATVLDKLAAAGRFVCLATPSMAQPAWMSRAYPDVLRAGADGRRRHHGRRTNYCPNSPNYRRLAANIAERLASRYADHPALVAWHVSNEYGGACYCETCASGFRH